MQSNQYNIFIIKLFEHIAGWYNINPSFASAVLSKFLPEYDKGINTLHDLYATYPEKRVQLEYAFSTNIRGRSLRKSLIERGFATGIGGGKRYLDIGCAYGGFLTAFSEIGYLADGIEYNADLVNLCTQHMQLSNFQGTVLHADFLDDNVIDQPIYDLITCNDVIEHVVDPARCIRKIYAMLKPGGCAYIETVNKMSLKNNTADIHFQFFGLNLLDHCRAAQMYKQLTGSPSYDVSEFYPIEWYINVANRLDGVSLSLINSTEDFDYKLDLTKAFEKFANWENTEGKLIDKFLIESVKIEFYKYMQLYFAQLEKSQSTNNMEGFHSTFSDPIVRFVMRKAI